MKIALAQMEVKPGRPKKNLENMLAMIEEAKRQHVDLIAFPEMCVGGYLIGDKFLQERYCRNLMEFNEAIRKASEGIAIAYGNIFVDDSVNERWEDSEIHPNKDGRSRKYNAVYVFQNGKEAERKAEAGILPAGVQPKTLLPNYRIFDDERYFLSLEDAAKDYGVPLDYLLQPFLIEVGGEKIPVGFEVCEDLWCADYRKEMEALNPTKILIDNGAELIVNISASPWTYGKNSARDRRIKFLKEESGEDFVPFLYVNCTGVQNNGKNLVTFDGGSTIYNKDGLPVIMSKAPYEQELIITEEKDFGKAPAERIEKERIAQKYDAIITGILHIKDTLGMESHPKFVIGLSGGIDSSVVAALLADAVGAGKILGVNMPTQYNSDLTKGAAAHVAKKLGIAYETIPIETLVEENRMMIDSIDPNGSGMLLNDFNMENVQAKIRGTAILSNLAAKYGALFTNNGNKLEVALGYATLYGDVGGAFAPIADLTKAEVFEMARYINMTHKDEIIPNILLPDILYCFREGAAPSGELKEKQIDPMKFGYHDAMLEAMTDYMKKSPEDVMQWYLDGELEKNLGISTGLIRRWKINDPEKFVEDLEWFASSVDRNVFKRVQGPPIIILSKSAFGYDIRESILPYETTIEFDRMKEKVLAMKEYAPAAQRELAEVA